MTLSYSPTVLLLLKATVLLVLALGVSSLMTRATAGSRHVLWLVTIVTLLLMPAVATWAPLRLAVLPSVPAQVAGPTNEMSSDAFSAASDDAVSNVSVRTEATDRVNTPVVSAEPSTITRITSWLTDTNPLVLLFAAWATVAAALLLRLAGAAAKVRGITSRATSLDTPDWQSPLMEVSDRLGLEQTPRLLASSETNMPFACGFRGTIVLPAACETWSLDRRYAVLLHEVAHIERRDLVGHTLSRVACALYWFHPLVWSAAKRLRAESERACDDLALVSGARASDYAEHLLDIITTVRRDTTPSVALAMARKKEFEGRMLAILDPDIRHARPNRLQTTALTACIGVIALVVGAAAPAPAAQQPTRQPAARSDVPQAAARPRAVAIASPESPASAVSPASPASPASPVVRVVRVAAPAPAANPSPAPVPTPTVPTDTRMRVQFPTSTVLSSVTKNSRDDERPALLAKVLRTDTSASLRRIAAWGLGQHSSSAVGTEALAAALRSDRDARVREMCAWALGESGGRNASDALAAALRDNDTRVRATAAWALGNTSARGATDALAAALSDTSASVRTRALWALGNAGLRTAPAAVRAALRDTSARVRMLAAWTLFEIEDPDAIPDLEAALRNEKQKELSTAYIRALAATGERSVSALTKLLDSSDPAVKSIAVRALAGGNATGPWPWPWPEPRPYP